MNKKIITATPEGLERLRVLERIQNGESRYSVAKDTGLSEKTISDWQDMYAEGGVERLNAPRKPRPKHKLDPAEIATLLATCSEDYTERLTRLLRVAKGETLKAVAESSGVSVQTIMSNRRKYERGELPMTIAL